MDSIYSWMLVVLASIVLGVAHYKAGYYDDLEKHNRYFRFLEFWRIFINYLIGGVVVYYFISVRYPRLKEGGDISGGDLALGLIFLLCAFGWTPYFLKNATEGTNGFFKKIFNR